MGQFGVGVGGVGAGSDTVAVDDIWGKIEDEVVKNPGRILVTG